MNENGNGVSWMHRFATFLAVMAFLLIVFGMAHVIWAVFAVLPPNVLVPLEAAHLPADILGAVVGAWLYKERAGS